MSIALWSFDVDDNGKIILNSNSYIKVSKKLRISFCNREEILLLIHF